MVVGVVMGGVQLRRSLANQMTDKIGREERTRRTTYRIVRVLKYCIMCKAKQATLFFSFAVCITPL